MRAIREGHQVILPFLRLEIEHDPLNAGAYVEQGWHAWYAGHLDEAEEDAGIVLMAHDPLLNDLEDDPRHAAMMKKLGFRD